MALAGLNYKLAGYNLLHDIMGILIGCFMLMGISNHEGFDDFRLSEMD